MEKIDIQKFRELKEEMIENFRKMEESDISDEEYDELLERCFEIMQLLSKFDLSEIDFSEWEGMILAVDKEHPLDFSKSRANLDFEIIEYESDFKGESFPNFKGCIIKNFPFEKENYSPEMFDEKYIEDNEDHFLSDSVTEDLKVKFYSGQLLLTDIVSNSELITKISGGNIDYSISWIYELIGKEEFLKLDPVFIDATGYKLDILRNNQKLKTAEEIMPVLYEYARDMILKYDKRDFEISLFPTQDKLGDRFKELNPDLFLSEETPEEVRNAYYSHELSLEMFSENLRYFQGKKVSQAIGKSFISDNFDSRIIALYGDEIYDLFSNYKLIMDKVISDRNIEFPVIPSEPITEEERKDIMSLTIQSYFRRVEMIEDFQMLKLISDFVSLESLPLNDRIRNILKEYDIDELIKLDLHFSELEKPVNDLNRIKELMEKLPLELINLGNNYHAETKRAFIEKYGIDNIIALNEETNGMFSHSLWTDDIYLLVLASGDFNEKSTENSELTYDEFREKMYKILVRTRDEGGCLLGGDFPGYDFISGRFREEHPEIFIDDSVSEEIKKSFYMGRIKAEEIRNNPELVKLLQGKNLRCAFKMTMKAGYSIIQRDEEGNFKSGIPNEVNMAEYISNKFGEEYFFDLCLKYGKCLDSASIFVKKDDFSKEELESIIEESIYKAITENGIFYFETLPTTFKEKHPELFLPEDFSEDIKNKFYQKKLTYEDIRKNPELYETLKEKNIKICFLDNISLSRWSGNRTIWDVLSEKEVLEFAYKYGKYLKNIDLEIFSNCGESFKEKEKVLQEHIEKRILDRSCFYDDTAPEFFKKKYPEMFLEDTAPEELKLYFYDSYKSLAEEYKNHSSRNYIISFQVLKVHPEWKKFIEGKNLKRVFPTQYSKLFDRFDSVTLMKLGEKSPQVLDKMSSVNNGDEIVETWYKATGGKFIPHHIVMTNFPIQEIDDFLVNGKKWSQLMRIDRYNLNDEGKSAILKVAYSMGVFQGNDDGFNKTMELFTGLLKELSQEEYEKVIQTIGADEEKKAMFEQVYKLGEDGNYGLKINEQVDKQKTKEIRAILEQSGISRILTPEKAHQIFDSFAMKYNPDFVRFFYENIEEILTNPKYIKDIATIQRQFKDIVRVNSGRRITLDVAHDYIRSIVYTDIDVGNEMVAEQAKIAGYSQSDFEAIQLLYNEGETRDFSSIPRIQGETEGYTYEMLRCDDPLALTIGTLTDCCQEIHGAGQTSMEHSVISPDGRVFCVRDSEGRIVAQSWFWRNQYTGCFDNIEIPKRIFTEYERQHPDLGRKGLTTDVLEVYKKAALELIQEDARVYQELLENGTITQEQYDSLLLGKITIGLGYNDIADAIKDDKTIHQESEIVTVIGTDRLPHPYTDARVQYTIAEREGIVKSEHENLYVHQDDVPVYDATNMSSTVLLTMKRMEQATERDNLSYVTERSDKTELSKSQIIINSIARNYGLNPDITKVMATSRIAIIYSQDEGKIQIGDLLSAPIKSELTEAQRQKAENHIRYQIKKALKQIGIQGLQIDISLLDTEQQQIVESIIQEIEKENSERGEV